MRKTLLALLLIFANYANAAEILLFGEINADMAHRVAGQIFSAEAETGAEPIKIYIDSGGGDVGAGGVIVDAILMCKTHPVYTIDIGDAGSMAAIVFSYGSQRIMWPHATLMYHSAHAGLNGTPEQIQSQLDNIKPIIAGYEKHVAAIAGISLTELRTREALQWWLHADEAVATHLATAVVSTGS